MEAIKDLNLSPSQLEQINACRVYLRMTMLAEIVDHTGQLILPQVLTLSKQKFPTGLNEISTSTVTWPNIHCPLKVSWSLWTKTICNLFTGADKHNKLMHSLGEWLPHHQVHHFWKWRMSLMTSLLHQQTPVQHPKAAIVVCAQQMQMTFSLTVPTNQSFDGPLVTPFDTHHWVVRLPVPLIQSSQCRN